MKQSFLSIVFCLLATISSVWSSAKKLQSNETELLAFQALQSLASLPSLHTLLASEVKKSVNVKAIPSLFAQQQGVQPKPGSYQLENFGALTSWENILQQLQEDPRRRLLIMVRHGQAWENLNPTPNSNCEFTLNGDIIENFDSPLTPQGIDQAQSLNQILRSPASNSSSSTWFETLGLTQETTQFITSPLSRTLQTVQAAFNSLPLPNDQSFVASELIRATIGRDVCNVRKSVTTPTSSIILPYPWQSGCKLPSDSLTEVYANSAVKMSFPIRPAGGSGFGLISDYDQLWRADVADDVVIQTRAAAFLSQLFEYTSPSSVTAVVTHGEMVRAIYEVAGEVSYNAVNTEVVPLLLTFDV
jgi:broad specificity phosphatase PhoE